MQCCSRLGSSFAAAMSWPRRRGNIGGRRDGRRRAACRDCSTPSIGGSASFARSSVSVHGCFHRASAVKHGPREIGVRESDLAMRRRSTATDGGEPMKDGWTNFLPARCVIMMLRAVFAEFLDMRDDDLAVELAHKFDDHFRLLSYRIAPARPAASKTMAFTSLGDNRS